MEPEGGLRNTRMREMRAEVVIKEDGRYLIYYSWPTEPDHPPDRARAGRTHAPDQQPWSPETDPSPETKASDV